MAKESTLKNMVLTLLLITLVSAAALGSVYLLTKDTIASARALRTIGALELVLDGFDNNPAGDTVKLVIDGLPITVYKATQSGKSSGFAVETKTKKGYGGEISMIIGFRPDGEIITIEVLSHSETPGFGDQITEPDNPLLLSLKGKNPAGIQMSLGSQGGDIDAITGSTVSSKAYVDAVERGYKAYLEAAQGIEAESAETDPFRYLFGEYTGNPADEMTTVTVDTTQVLVYPVRSGGTLLGYAVEGSSEKGFHHTVKLMTGFATDDTITGVFATESNESSGWGAVIGEPDNTLEASLKGKNAGEVVWEFSANGGTIDAISGSTYTSDAFLEAVKRAYIAYQSFILNQ